MSETQQNDMNDMPLLNHLEELRSRIIRTVFVLSISFVGCYIISEEIVRFITTPLTHVLQERSELTMLTIQEGFITHLKVSFVAACVFSSVFIFYELWAFIAPGLYPGEKKLAFPFVFFSSTLFLTGAGFGFYVVFPYGFQFLLSFQSEIIVPRISISAYISFVSYMLLIFGLVFELPILSYFLARLGIITSAGMAKQRRMAILMIFIIGAALTPPDAVTQVMLAGPVIVLYEISIWVARIAQRKAINVEQENESEETIQ